MERFLLLETKIDTFELPNLVFVCPNPYLYHDDQANFHPYNFALYKQYDVGTNAKE